MNKSDRELWAGLSKEAQAALVTRDYSAAEFSRQVAEVGVEAGKLVSADRASAEVGAAWIPGRGSFRAGNLSATPSWLVWRIRPPG